MNSEKLAGILGAIVAVSPWSRLSSTARSGQFGKPPLQAQKAAPAAAVAAVPAVRGPVVREVPQ